MSREQDQKENSADDEARTTSPDSSSKDVLPFVVDTREDTDNVQAQSVVPEKKSAKPPEAAEVKLSDPENQAQSGSDKDLSAKGSGSTEGEPPGTGNQENDQRLPDNTNQFSKLPESTQPEVPGMDSITRNEEKRDMSDVSELNLSREESVLFEVHSSKKDDLHRLDQETPDRERTSAKYGRTASSASSPYDISSEEYTLLLEQLTEERAKATEHNKQLQMKLAAFFNKKTSEEQEAVGVLRGLGQADSYESCLKVLMELKRQVKEDMETAERQAEELRLQAQEKLSKVDKEWHKLMSLKKDTTVMVLSRRRGKPGALASVESVLAAEERQQDELTKLRLHNLRLMTSIQRLEMELRKVDVRSSDPLQLEYEQLQCQRQESKIFREKQNEKALKVQKKMARNLELLSNLREKLHWTKMEVQSKREQLVRLDSTVATKRNALTSIKQSCNRLQRDNVKLKERRGLLGNEVLLRDYDRTTEACAQLEEKLQQLKCRQDDLDFYLGKTKRRLETA